MTLAPIDPRAVLAAAGLPEKPEWRHVSTRRERHEDRRVTVTRYQAGGYRLGGPHRTVVVDDNAVLLGFTDLDPFAVFPREPPPAETLAHDVAAAFLAGTDPGYAAALTVLWIDPHSEIVTADDGTEHKVTGMKVKTRHAGGLYAWVVVGPRGRVLTYERDVRWDPVAGRRATQMWLHDSWIAAHDGDGPPPPPPYSRI
ncbi:hypothetical protein [Allonocardiopsis opalescens]|uniref:Uncharacterized protein n=1 Tax=Allonocardiopsis opalescens TaxID=1144618 RepID=A0A2T0QAU6_9ACTN|nr:hypothetical protein [Allonocardiopsis opalescens]PRY01018.1 hypothetical protein CLV72_102654 [Allonocardiopsis opalescens]